MFHSTGEMQVPDKIKFGVFLPFYIFRTEKRTSQLFNRLQGAVLECERLGYYSFWLDDHLMLNKMPILECWTTLSALSMLTEKIRLGTMVTCNSFRNPALLAKMAATLDNISNGRLELGIGAGVQNDEPNTYGFPFLSANDMVERLSEAVEIIRKIAEGAPFKKMAKQFSTCPSSKKGGDLGFFVRGDMVKAFESAAFSMQKGEISAPVESIYGFHEWF